MVPDLESSAALCANDRIVRARMAGRAVHAAEPTRMARRMHAQRAQQPRFTSHKHHKQCTHLFSFNVAGVRVSTVQGTDASVVGITTMVARTSRIHTLWKYD